MGIVNQTQHTGLSRILVIAAAFGCGLLAAIGASAAAADGAGGVSSSSDAQPGEIAEITVTARRREESLEKVPVAVEVLNSEALAEANVRSQEDLQRTVSGLVIRQSQNQNDETYAMRGATTDAFSGMLPGVLPYINDVQFNSLSSNSFFDLASIQVLKGPQGTLFGRNTTGGAVLYTTARPTDQFGGYATVGGGNYDAVNVQGAVNLPLIDNKLLLRIAGDYTYNGGYVRNIGNGQMLGVTDRKSGRVTLLAKPFEGFESLTTMEFDKSGGNNVGAYAYSVYPLGATNNGYNLAGAAASLFTPYLDNVTGPGSWANFLKLNPGSYAPGVIAFHALEQTFPKYTVWDFNPSKHNGQNWFVSNTTTYTINDNLSLKNIIGDSQSFTDDLEDLFGAPYPFEPQVSNNGTGYHYATNEVSEEFQIIGSTSEQKLTYITGLYTSYEMQHNVFQVTPFDVPLVGVSRTDNFQLHDLTYAAFAQGTWNTVDLTHVDHLNLTIGGRYGGDNVKLRQLPTDVYYGLAPEEKNSFKKPSWQVGLEYQATPNLLLYVEQRGSWRSGGFNGTAPPVEKFGSQGGNEFKPETVRDVEVGVKFAGDLGGVPTRINLAAYDSWIKEIQRVEYVNVPFNGGIVLAGLTANIPAATVKGVELDADFKLTNWLRVGGNFAYTDAKFTDNVSVIFTQVQVFGPFPDTPKFAGTVYGEVTIPTKGGDVAIRTDVYHQTSQFFSSQNNGAVPDTELAGYTLLGAHIDWRHVFGSNLTLSAYGKNLTDKFYFTGGLAQGGAFGLNGATLGVPRMYGAQATYKF
jgi:iron complex outermembrane receptor protein